MVEFIVANKFLSILIIVLISMTGMGFIIEKFGHSIFKSQIFIKDLKNIIVLIIVLVIALLVWVTILKVTIWIPYLPQ